MPEEMIKPCLLCPLIDWLLGRTKKKTEEKDETSN